MRRNAAGADRSSSARRGRHADYIGNRSLVLFDSGDEVVGAGRDEGIRFLLVSGKPIEEPVAWYGPIVMNTRSELRVALDEFPRNVHQVAAMSVCAAYRRPCATGRTAVCHIKKYARVLSRSTP